MKLQVDALRLGPHGYGEYARGLVAALDALGHDIRLTSLLPHQNLEEFGPWGETCARCLGSHQRPDLRLLVMPYGHFAARPERNSRTAAVTMVERGSYDRRLVETLNALDAVFVPCGYNETLFRAHGVAPPITRVWPPLDAGMPQALEGKDEPYCFLSVFEWYSKNTSHKDPETLIRAYVEEFDADEPVRLRIKVHSDLRMIARYLRDLKGELGVKRAPEIEIAQGAYSRDEQWRLFQTSDAYVSPHHSEGWGLPLFEAMGMGLPTIGTGFGGNLDFMHAENSLLLGYTMDNERLWANADRAELRRHMRWLFEHRPQGRELGRRARAELREKFTLARTAEMLEEGLRAL